MIWSNDQLAPQFNSPVLKNGLLFGLTDKGFFFCIDAKSGKTAWTDKTNRGGGFGASSTQARSFWRCPPTPN